MRIPEKPSFRSFAGIRRVGDLGSQSEMDLFRFLLCRIGTALALTPLIEQLKQKSPAP